MSDDTECRQLCTFRIDGLLFGVEITHVQEVLRAQPMTPVPLANAAVRGLINLRGQIVTALDLRHRLGLAALPPGIEPVSWTSTPAASSARPRRSRPVRGT
jgi:purine-binding chemotaxis protein CheW